MSRFCDFCLKGYQKAKQVPRGIGNRCTKRTTIKRMANLRSKKIDVGGQNVRVTICSSCLKRIKKNTSDQAAKEVKA